jgi:hypothetical protein
LPWLGIAEEMVPTLMMILGAFSAIATNFRGTNMPRPNDAASLPLGASISRLPNCNCWPSSTLVQLLVAARSGYDWPAGTGAAASQHQIINLETAVRTHLAALTAHNAHQIVVDVSLWAANNTISHAHIVAATSAQQVAMCAAINNLVTPVGTSRGIDALCALPGIRLVIASKIFRFCSPQRGAAVDRHASYFFNSLPIVGHGSATSFSRQWANRGKTTSRLAIYSQGGYARNRNEYLQSYLPILACIADALNSSGNQYRCAVTTRMKNWTPADVEMAAYSWWACHGAR